MINRIRNAAEEAGKPVAILLSLYARLIAWGYGEEEAGRRVLAVCWAGREEVGDE